MKHDLLNFSFIYVIVFWVVVANDPISFALKLCLFAGCFLVMGGAYCGLKAIWRRARVGS